MIMEECMAVAAHVKELENKHAQIDRQIQTEQKNPLPDTLRITSLKKQKLHLKDQIHAHLDK